MFQLRHIEYLYALAGIPVMVLLFWLLLNWKRKATKRIGDPQLVKQLISGFSRPLFNLKFILIVIAFAFVCLALGDLVKPDPSQKIERKGIDVMIALDVSNSMLAEDIKPNRLERAKQVVSRIIDRLSDDRIGLVIFAGKAYVQMPMTTDHSAAHMYLSSISTDDVPTQGTAIGQALKMCYSAFNTKEKKYRAVILITDGEDHDEDAIKVAGQLADEGVMVNTVGIGSPQGSPIMDKETKQLKTDENGNTVITKLNEQVLQEIAAKGHGTYQLFTTTDAVASNIRSQLASMGETTLTDSSTTSYINYFWYFILTAFILLTLEFFLPETRKKLAAFTTVLVMMILPASAQEKKTIIKGNEQYKKEKYQEAASTYEKALESAPDNTIASHNLGNAYYRMEKPDEAAKAYDRTISGSKDKETKARAYYNKGVAFQSQKKLPECIDAYKNTLKLKPDDEEARQNLQRALMQMKQQEQQNKDQKKNDDQKKKQDQKKDQDKNKKQQEEEPKPQPSKLTKQDAEEKLKSLLDHEKDLHDKLRKVKASSPEKPKKDW